MSGLSNTSLSSLARLTPFGAAGAAGASAGRASGIHTGARMPMRVMEGLTAFGINSVAAHSYRSGLRCSLNGRRKNDLVLTTPVFVATKDSFESIHRPR